MRAHSPNVPINGHHVTNRYADRMSCRCVEAEDCDPFASARSGSPMMGLRLCVLSVERRNPLALSVPTRHETVNQSGSAKHASLSIRSNGTRITLRSYAGSSSGAREQLRRNLIGCLQSKVTDARFVAASHALIERLPWITVTRRTRIAACSARTAIWDSGNSRTLPNYSSRQRSTSALISRRTKGAQLRDLIPGALR